MRRSRSFSAGLLAAGLWLAGRAAPAQQIPVGLGGVPTSFLGLPFDVPVEVNLSGRSDLLGSFALTIRWNPAVLAFVKGQDGNFGALTTNVDSAGGVIRLTGANPGGVGGHVVVGVGRFVPLVSAADTFKINVTELYAARTFADLLPSAVWANKPFCPAVGRYGDIDGNGVANSADALAALTYAVGKPITGNPVVGDVDGDGLTGARDALVILAYAVGLDVTGFRILAPSAGGCGVAPGRLPLQLVPGNVTLDLAQSARYTAVATDSTGAAVAVTDLSWASSDTAVAKVDSAGVVTALTPGVATIRVMRLAGDTAAATVTVIQRHTHWVDAFASPDSSDQLGAPELPFATIPQALAYARSGDTVMVRPGRYEDGIQVTRPVVIAGDTSGGWPRPFIAATGPNTTGFTVNAGGRFELQRLRFDTLFQGLHVQLADTLVVRDVELRSRSTSYAAALTVDSAVAVLVQRSGFFGAGRTAYAHNAVWVNAARVVSLDSTLVSDFGSDGVYLSRVDSLFVRTSRFRHNLGYGIYSCTNCYGVGAGSAVVFTGDRFIGNGNGPLYLNKVRSARFDHNVMRGGYTAAYLYGDTAQTVVTMLADSVDATTGGWLYLINFDSLAIDSAWVRARAGAGSIQGGRAVSVRNSRFAELTGTGLSVTAAPRAATQLVLRGLEFRGPDSSSCVLCGYGISGTSVALDADSLTLSNLWYGFSLSNSRASLQRVTLQGYYYGVYLSCSLANVTGASMSDGTWGVYSSGNGCTTPDSLMVTGSAFARHNNSALYSYYVPVNVSSSTFQNSVYALQHTCAVLRASNISATGGTYGVYASGCVGANDSAMVDRSSFSRQSSVGVYTSFLAALVTNSTFSGDRTAMELDYAPVSANDNQVVDLRGGYGIYVYADSGKNARLLRNTIACNAAVGAMTGIYAQRYYTGRDTITIADSKIQDCTTGIDVPGVAGHVEVLRDTLSLPPGGTKAVGGDADSLLRIAGNVIAGPGQYGSIRVEYGPRRVEVDSNTISGSVQAGIYQLGGDTLAIRGNVLSGHGAGTCCLYTTTGAIVLDGSAASNVSAVVSGNRITDTHSNGIALLRDFGDTVTVLVDSNTVKRADSMGVWVRYYSRANIRKNAIDSAGIDAVRLDQYSGVVPAVVNFNNFSRSVRKAVNNVGLADLIDATNNWWNDVNGPKCATGATGCTVGALGDSVSASVTFLPYLGSADPLVPLPAPPVIAAARFRATAGWPLSPPLAPTGVPALRGAAPTLVERRAPEWRVVLPDVPLTPEVAPREAGPLRAVAARLRDEVLRQRLAELRRFLEDQARRIAERERQQRERESALEASRQPPRAARPGGRPQ